ncbi:phosphoribosyltransferase [Amycolatopsis suaedae]|uniref:Phosphoribosyltransferase n=1 Tax=Amycolatopsis suaedae TaxID=2510978 RepID=A0A4Q7IZQ1_9PSEU|nr:phosphoribosyltransferase family protein [Amycolatopsis suaedae]RZQ59977.1 phosphoribosyltransferase [Amycolatopsis suaedae]
MRATRIRAFPDRAAAGRQLGELLARREWHEPVVLGLARGGVPVAEPVARALDAPLGVAVARKIGAPGQPELGVGAVTADGPAYFDRRMLRRLGLSEMDMAETCERERAEAARRLRLYRGDDEPEIGGRDVVLVDDGLATGVTARAAARDLAGREPARIVFASPVCAPGAEVPEADELFCVVMPPGFGSVGNWYRDFAQTTDDEVMALLG